MRHIGREALELDDSDRTYAQTPHIVGANSPSPLPMVV
jgi:hypothetical protein